MAGFDALVIGGEREMVLQERGALGFGLSEVAGEQSRVSKFEIVGAVFALGTEEDIPVRHG